MAQGTLVYKCRRCNETHAPSHVPNGYQALACATQDISVPSRWGGGKIPMFEIHYCADDALGVSDLIGFEYDKEAPHEE